MVKEPTPHYYRAELLLDLEHALIFSLTLFSLPPYSLSQHSIALDAV